MPLPPPLPDASRDERPFWFWTIAVIYAGLGFYGVGLAVGLLPH